jgi:hypothetical protein
VQLEQLEAALVVGHRETHRELEAECKRDQPVEDDREGAVALLRRAGISCTQFRPPR